MARRADGIDGAELGLFCAALLDDDEAAEALARRAYGQLASFEALGEALFAPAALALGDLWVEDEASFAVVTLGMAALQRIAWSLAREVRVPPPRPGQTRLLLAVAPGEQHSFGLHMLYEALRERGGAPAWLPYPTLSELEAAVRGGGFEAVGLSVGSWETVERLPDLVARLRQAAPRPIHLFAGGPAAAQLLALPGLGGLDEVIDDAPVERLQQLLFAERRAAA